MSDDDFQFGAGYVAAGASGPDVLRGTGDLQPESLQPEVADQQSRLAEQADAGEGGFFDDVAGAFGHDPGAGGRSGPLIDSPGADAVNASLDPADLDHTALDRSDVFSEPGTPSRLDLAPEISQARIPEHEPELAETADGVGLTVYSPFDVGTGVTGGYGQVDDGTDDGYDGLLTTPGGDSSDFLG